VDLPHIQEDGVLLIEDHPLPHLQAVVLQLEEVAEEVEGLFIVVGSEEVEHAVVVLELERGYPIYLFGF
jgi:hypothetical protein